MEQIQKLCEKFSYSTMYKDYRIIINCKCVIVSIAPRNNENEELVWQVDNTDEGKEFLVMSMQKTLKEI